MLLDVAVSVVARGKTRQAAKAGTAIPEGWPTDREGAY